MTSKYSKNMSSGGTIMGNLNPGMTLSVKTDLFNISLMINIMQCVEWASGLIVPARSVHLEFNRERKEVDEVMHHCGRVLTPVESFFMMWTREDTKIELCGTSTLRSRGSVFTIDYRKELT